MLKRNGPAGWKIPQRPRKALLLIVVILMIGTIPIEIQAAAQADQINITVNPIVPLHKMKQADIARLRKAKINEYKRLRIYPDPYAPDPAIYDSIDEQADWINDTQFYISNPYLLVLSSAGTMVNALLSYCGKVGVAHSGNMIQVSYRGESARKWFTGQYDYYPDSKGVVRLWFVNALDAGFKYAHVDELRSTNIEPIAGTPSDHVMNGVYAAKEFFHRGRKGKNNISPDDPRAKLRLQKRDERTIIYVKLWRKPPGNVDAKEDLAYVIDIDPSTEAASSSGFSYSAYKPSSLEEIGDYAKMLGAEHEGGFEFFANKYRVRTALDQHPAPISTYVRTALTYHSKTLKFLKPEHLKLFTHQLDLKKGDHSFVLVFQEQLVPFLQEEIRPGDSADLYVVLAAYDCTYKMTILLVNEFKSEKGRR